MKKTLVVLMLFVMIISVGCAKEAVLKQEDVSNIGNNEVEKSNEISVTDVSGKEIILSEKPEKVISLYASFADLWYEAGGDLVGICDSRTLPEKVADLPKVGKMSTPNVEAILALEPDFIIVRDGYVKQEEIIPLLIENNIVVYLANYNNFSEMLKVYKDFC
ncbi:MAG: ABC transporter substrate-binding protein, partial [Bacillota bacterium]|nr:ABC transporter substrate-binding protein [Bacillota bacterium]